MGTRLISLENVQWVSFQRLLEDFWVCTSTAQSLHVALSKLNSAAVDLLYPCPDQRVLHQTVSSKDGTLLGRLNLSCTQS